jgi:hypothetical protein
MARCAFQVLERCLEHCESRVAVVQLLVESKMVQSTGAGRRSNMAGGNCCLGVDAYREVCRYIPFFKDASMDCPGSASES